MSTTANTPKKYVDFSKSAEAFDKIVDFVEIGKSTKNGKEKEILTAYANCFLATETINARVHKGEHTAFLEYVKTLRDTLGENAKKVGIPMRVTTNGSINYYASLPMFLTFLLDVVETTREVYRLKDLKLAFPTTDEEKAKEESPMEVSTLLKDFFPKEG